MADTKISALPASTTPLAGTEVLPIVQSGVTKKVSVADLTLGRAVASAGGTFSDNFVQGTAAKGINFAANTPATPGASQLLNWYESNTYTPVVSSATGTITSYSAGGRYTRVGNQVTASFDIEITNNGTGGGLLFVSLPVAAAGPAGGTAIEYAATGNIIGAITYATQITAYMVNASNGAYPAATGYKIRGSITYICS